MQRMAGFNKCVIQMPGLKMQGIVKRKGLKSQGPLYWGLTSPLTADKQRIESDTCRLY